MYRLVLRTTLFLTTALALRAGPALTDLVDDQSAIVVEVSDINTLKSGWANSPFGRSWADPEFQRFFAPLVAQIESEDLITQFKDKIGRTPTELLELASGRLLLVWPASIVDQLAEGTSDTSDRIPPFLLAADVGEHGAELEGVLDDSLKKQKEEIRHDTEKFGEVTVHLISQFDSEDDVLVWAVSDGVWLFSSRKEAVLDALDAQMKGGRSDALGRSPTYLAARDQAHDPALFAYVDWQVLYPSIERIVRDAKKHKGKSNPMEFDPAATMKAMGLEDLTTLAFGTVFSDKSVRSSFVINYRQQRGLFKLLAYRDGPVSRPDWVPASWFNVGSANFSPSEAVSQLLTLLSEINPIVGGMAQGQLANLNRQLGIDIERDLIGSLGEQFISANILPAGATLNNVPPHDELNQFIAISLADPSGFQRSLDAAKRVIGPGFEKAMVERDYLGRKLYSFTPPNSGQRGFSYSIADRWLFLGIGSSAPVEAAIQGLDSRETGFYGRDDVRDALAQIPGGAFSVQYQDMRVLMSAICATLIKIQPADEDSGKRFVDPDARPSFETISRYWSNSINYGLRVENGIRLESELTIP